MTALAGGEVVIRCEGLAVDGAGPVGYYLAGFDPDARDGQGEVTWTANVDVALRFPDATAAVELWRKPSAVRPLRADGKPNRPLTAFSVTIERAP